MVVVDIRNLFAQRNIEIFEINDAFIYYSEEKHNEDGQNSLYLLEYNRSSRRERLISNYTLQDPTFIQHIFALTNSIIIILENGSNSLWLIEVDKQSGMELNRRKIVCTGSFSECKPLDDEHLIIYMEADEQNADVFKKYKQATGCDRLCYTYNLRTNKKYFVKGPMLAKLSCDDIKIIESNGERQLILLDPFSDEEVKEHYYREKRWISADIRDNIWLCTLSTALAEIECGCSEITFKSIASADIKGSVRYCGMSDENVYLKVKQFKTGMERLCAYNKNSGELTPSVSLDPPESSRDFYCIEQETGKIHLICPIGNGKVHVKGILNSDINATYDNALGKFVTCIEDRFIIANKTVQEPNQPPQSIYSIYDTQSDLSESYECNCEIKNQTLVLY